MKRISSPSGSQVNFEKTVDSIQDSSFSNLVNRVKSIITQMGISMQVTNGVNSTELKAGLINTGTDISVQSGKALTTSGEYISVGSQQNISNPVGVSDNSGYGVIITYKEVGSNPVKALNAFVYDKLGGQSLSRKTVYNDSFEITTQAISGTLADFKGSLSSNQLLLAVVWRTAGTFSEVAGYPEETLSDFTIADLRADSRLFLSSSLLDDNTILFRDRPSVGDNAFSQDIEFSGDVLFHNIVPATGADGTLSANSITMVNGNARATNIAGTSAQDFFVRVGSTEAPNGYKLVVSDGPISTPSNVRMHSIQSTKDKDEPYSLVTFRWNWDHLRTGSPVSTGDTSVVIGLNSYQNETITVGSDFIGKKLLFTSSSNSYEITGEGVTPNEVIILGALAAEDVVSEAQPMRVIDKNTKQYVFTVKDSVNFETQVLVLDESFVKKPEIAMRLPLGETYSYSLQGVNNSEVSNTEAGSSDFENKLEDLLGTASMNLSSDAQGFIVDIGGWEAAHEIEVIYSSKIDLTQMSNPFSDINNTDIERGTMRTRRMHVSAGRPSLFTVAARPIINKQPVIDDSKIVFGTVTSGGGGLLPEEQTLIQADFDIKVVKGVVKGQNPDNEIDEAANENIEIEWVDYGGHTIFVDDKFLDGRKFVRVDINGDPIDVNENYRINEVSGRTDLINGRKVIKFNRGGKPILTVDDPVKTGISKEDRFIVERPLSFDYIITGIHVDLKSIKDVAPNDGAIIRVYQKDRESNAAEMELEGYTESTVSQIVNMPLTRPSNGGLILVVDAFDPDQNSPNNRASLAGKVTVVGKPKIVDNF